ncbi:unnamed protein product [Rhizoctonia solani]|uniref:Uncharacterized protein n=1 Tax=Rhizoctonia solani TaxID=456999 RepID=A0A8H2X7L0_9AGAM|nr:unnamed protein product [Rhizoctonia solani]
MTWLRKKKPNPEDGDFPTIPKHYCEQKGKILTKSIKIAPALHWSGGATVVWGIDVGPRITTVSFAYLLTGEPTCQGVEVHNIVYWPKAFPVRQSANSEVSLPEVEKTHKLRETHEATGFTSHPSWPSERTANYVHVVGTASSPPAFQVRTELPFIEVANERHKYVDLVAHLLKHALSVYGVVIKPEQPRWSRASDIVVSLPSGISKSAEISVTDALNRMIQRVMPKHNDTFMNVDWDLATGDMVCASYGVRCLPSGQIAFDIRQRSYLQSTPIIRKRVSSADEQEGTRFASALHWVAEQKHGSRKLIIRVSNLFKKSEGLLAAFHNSLANLGLQVGIRLIDSTTETGAFGAVLWRIAHVTASSDQSNECDTRLVRDVTALQAETSAGAPEPSELELSRLSRNSRIAPDFYPERGSRPMLMTELPVDFASTPLSWSPHVTLPATPVARNSYLSISQTEIARASDNVAGSSVALDFPEHGAVPQTFPPTYISNHGAKLQIKDQYCRQNQSVEVHNIIYWPKAFPLRQSNISGEPLPEVKEKKTYKIREVHEATGFVSHSAWSYEKTTNYVHIVGAGNSPAAFQVRTELPFIEVSSERHKYVDLVEHLLKHALSVYGAAVKPRQPRWSCASDVVVSLPSGISKSAEISVTDALNHMIQSVMPKVIGATHVYYVPRPDLRPFEDDTWRNIDTSFQPSDTFMVVDWDLATGDMVCASFAVRGLPSGQIAFDTQQRSYLQSTPATRKRDSSVDEQESARFANALHWVAEKKHNVQKLIICVSNPFKKSEGLLSSFHKALTELGLQVGVRLVDPTAETGAFAAVMWRVAHAIASGDPSNGDDLQLVRDAATVPQTKADEHALRPTDSELGEKSCAVPFFHSDQGSRPASTAESPAAFVSAPAPWSPPAMHSITPATRHSYLSSAQVDVMPQTPDSIVGPSTISDSPEDGVAVSPMPPPAYADADDTKPHPPEKERK